MNWPCNLSVNVTILNYFWDASTSEFDDCFLFVIVLLSNLIWFAVNVYNIMAWQMNLLGRPGTALAMRSLLPYVSILLRLTASILILLLLVADEVLYFALHAYQKTELDALKDGLQVFVWLTHVMFLVMTVWRRTAIPYPVTLFVAMSFGWFLICLSWSLQCYNVFLTERYYTSTSAVFLLCRMGFQVLYLIGIGMEVHFRRTAGSVVRPRRREDSTTDRLITDDGYAEIYLGNGDDGANWLSRCTFWWTIPLMLKGYRCQLISSQALYKLPRALETHTIQDCHSDVMERCKARSYNSSSGNNISISSHPTLMRSLHLTFGCQFYSLGILKFVSDVCAFGGPWLLNRLVTFMEDSSQPARNGYMYALAMFGITLVNALCSVHFGYWMGRVKLKAQAAIQTRLYGHILGLSAADMSQFSVGQIINFMGVDTPRILNYCDSFHAFWSIPFQIGLSFYLLYSQVGIAFVVGVGFTLLLIPINRWIANGIVSYTTIMMREKDKRVKLMTEVLLGIRVVKLSGWERIFESQLNALRSSEVRALAGRKYLDALCVYLWAACPVVVALSTFATYTLLGHELTAAKVFTAMALFNMLIYPLNVLPWAINGLLEAWVSLQRLQRFMDVESDTGAVPFYICPGKCDQHMDALVCLHNCTLSWGNLQEKPVLIIEEMAFKEGQLTGIGGPVGAGKSSLFSSLLGELYCTSGNVYSVGFCSGKAVSLASQITAFLSGLGSNQLTRDVCPMQDEPKGLTFYYA